MFGLVQVTRTVAQSRDLVPMLSAVLETQGLGAYTNTEAATVGGMLLAASNVLALVLAIGFSVPRVRTHRRAFWIPLASAGAALIATTAITLGLVASDPAYLSQLRLGG